ncbi:hypothetical protein HN803_05825 [candidate division WWE3 bacterium]|jgi:hypothetical protein|nr:hypothetical protein [candidate division WWE3 bacterium]MBT7350273.1 hypothetical protein [candidate division WWE3 bacterium]
MKILYCSYLEDPEHASFEGEDKDEKIILTVRKHHITNTKWMMMAVVMFYLPTLVRTLLVLNGITFYADLPASYKFISFAFWYVLTFGYIFTSYLTWFYNVHLVTNKRIIDIDFQGLIHRRFSEAFLFNVEDLTHQISGALQILFHYGSVHIQTAGELRELEFEKIPQPAKVQDIISDLASITKGGGRKHND